MCTVALALAIRLRGRPPVRALLLRASLARPSSSAAAAVQPLQSPKSQIQTHETANHGLTHSNDQAETHIAAHVNSPMQHAAQQKSADSGAPGTTSQGALLMSSTGSAHAHASSTIQQDGAKLHRVNRAQGDGPKRPVDANQVLSIPELFSQAHRIELPAIKKSQQSLSSNMLTSSSARALSMSKIEERMALVYASLKTGDLDRAEAVFNLCWRSNPVQIRSSINSAFVNLFIECHLRMHRADTVESMIDQPHQSLQHSLLKHAGHEQRALDWLRRFSDFSLAPDCSTYAILCQHYLKVGNPDRVRTLVTEFEALGNKAVDLIHDERFASEEERMPLVALLRSMDKMPAHGLSDQENTNTHKDGIDAAMDKLLMSAMEDSGSNLTATSSLSQTNDNASTETGSSNSGNLLDGSDLAPEDALDFDELNSRLLNTDSSESLSSLLQQGNNASAEDVPQMRLSEMLRQERAAILASTGASNVKTLSRALSAMNDIGNMDRYQQQIWLEERAYAASLEQHESFVNSLPANLRRDMLIPSDTVRAWCRKLTPLIKQEIETLEMGQSINTSESHLPFLKLMPPEKLANITVRELLKTAWSKSKKSKDDMNTSVSALVVVTTVGRAVEHEHNQENMALKSNKKMLKNEMDIHKLHSHGRLFDMNVRRVAEEMTKRDLKLKKDWRPVWGQIILTKVGSFLADLAVRIATVSVQAPDPENPGKSINTDVPAFEHKLIREGKKTVGVFLTHPALLEILSNNASYIPPVHLPMLVKPKPWLTASSGGYLQTRSELMRIHSNPEHKDYLLAADEANHLTLVLRALDILGSTAWEINTAVYRVAAELWNKGVSVSSMPSALVLPEIPVPPNIETDSTAKRSYHYKVLKRNQALANNYSIRCDVNYKLEIAKNFLGEAIYFPHNLDFRGRAYPMPPHLHHMGNDLCRGLLTFREKRPLGESGLRWLKIQASNLAGLDKASLDEREAFAQKHREDIIDSAENPIDGRRWWMDSENPWQLLATCFELSAAWKHDNPTEFLSSLPIHQDGSCNGLQHYAALGGDVRGARSVNLLPSNVPQDVYRSVSDQVQIYVNEDAKKGVSEAILMKTRITRKLVKQTVMTNTYGVTFVGARNQVRSRLKEANASGPAEMALTDEQITKCSYYITKLTFLSIGAIFEGARHIQLWLNRTARTIAKSIPIDDVPAQQMSDSEQLAKMGLLPNPLSAIQTEHEASADPMDGGKDASPEGSPSLLENAALDDMADIPGDESQEDLDTTGSNDSIGGEDHEELFGQDFSIDQEWDRGLAEKEPIQIKGEPNLMPTSMTSVIWTTPLGLPVVQPYRNYSKNPVMTKLQSFVVADIGEPSPVDPQRQSSAFPPNFVHSLDASHMMLTAIACQARGIEYAAVHDSYWTHAATVDDMNAVLREAFVRLHSENIMTRLRNELLARYRNHKLPISVRIEGKETLTKWAEYEKSQGRKPRKHLRARKVVAWVDLTIEELPPRGDFDVTEVRNSKYFFH